VNLFHITTRKAWLEATRVGTYAPASLSTEGFIHCSTARQVRPVGRQFYEGQKGLVLLVIDAARLRSTVKWEPPSGGTPGGLPQGQSFPHVYGPIQLEAVVDTISLTCDARGHLVIPDLSNGSAEA
jgi:uncharacterized protein (DUF952 family)